MATNTAKNKGSFYLFLTTLVLREKIQLNFTQYSELPLKKVDTIFFVFYNDKKD